MLNRLDALDWLRGLLALSIMVYHLTGWELHQPDASGLLGRLGIYGVSMFFALSGLSMAAGYAGFIRDPRSAIRFFVRRIFRIWPLLWLAVAADTLGRAVLKGQEVDWALVLLNLTTLFGFVSPGAYINTGAWSIGNEMVYYALTPLLLPLYDRSTRMGNAVLAATVAAGMYFAFAGFDRQATLATQWSTYIHPLNNAMFYAVGVALYYNVREWRFRAHTPVLIVLLSLALLAGYPTSGDLINVVTGAERIAFFLASTGIVLGFFKLSLVPPAWIANPLAALGIATYGVYLLHPIVYSGLQASSGLLRMSPAPATMVGTTIVVTIALSLLVHRVLEAPLIRVGKRLTTGAAGKQPPQTLGRGRPSPGVEP